MANQTDPLQLMKTILFICTGNICRSPMAEGLFRRAAAGHGDYRVFSAGVLPLLQRFHGATRHVGKVARRHEGSAQRLRLRTQLREAIAREDYEEAARLRDRLRLKDPQA